MIVGVGAGLSVREEWPGPAPGAPAAPSAPAPVTSAPPIPPTAASGDPGVTGVSPGTLILELLHRLDLGI